MLLQELRWAEQTLALALALTSRSLHYILYVFRDSRIEATFHFTFL
jgi:hypothetical protein